MKTHPFKIRFCTSVAALALSGCGGSSLQTAQPVDIANFTSSYTQSLAALATATGMKSAALADLFDPSYLESGVTKSDVIAALNGEADVSTASTEYSSFPQMLATNISITDCDVSTQLCNMSVTLTNSDADSTSLVYTTRLKFSDKLRLFGDQSKT
jgi:hypothetical protein